LRSHTANVERYCTLFCPIALGGAVGRPLVEGDDVLAEAGGAALGTTVTAPVLVLVRVMFFVTVPSGFVAVVLWRVKFWNPRISVFDCVPSDFVAVPWKRTAPPGRRFAVLLLWVTVPSGFRVVDRIVELAAPP
jgi:hypothetical protein